MEAWQKFIESDNRRLRKQRAEIRKHELSVDPNFFEHVDTYGNNYFPSKKEFIHHSDLERQAIEQDREYWRKIKRSKTHQG